LLRYKQQTTSFINATTHRPTTNDIENASPCVKNQRRGLVSFFMHNSSRYALLSRNTMIRRKKGNPKSNRDAGNNQHDRQDEKVVVMSTTMMIWIS